jgi:hypothetical protein
MPVKRSRRRSSQPPLCYAEWVMAKPRKKTAAPEPPPMAQVGDKVKPYSSEMVYEISHVSKEGNGVNLHVPGTNLERFRVLVSDLTFVERKSPAKTSNPFKAVDRIKKLLEE